MEEKKYLKISLSTFFLIISIIIIVVMGYFIYKISVEKTNAEKKVNALEDTTNTLQNKINSISNVLSSDNTSTHTENANISNTNNVKETNTTETNTSTTSSSTNSSRNVKYEFTSADNAAAQGYPKILKIFELTGNELDFDYNSGFDFIKSTIDRQVTGTAIANAEQQYEFEETVNGHKYKLIFEFNEAKDTVRVYEFDNGNELGYINLWR